MKLVYMSGKLKM